MVENQKDWISSLTQLGLTQYEAKIHSALITNGTCSAKELSNICGIPYGKTYEVINSLVNRGFAIVLPTKPMKYKSSDPENILKSIESKMAHHLEHAKDLFKDFKAHQKESDIKEPKGSFWILHGRSAINQKISELITKAKKSVFLFLTGNTAHRMMYFKELLEKQSSKGVEISIVGTKNSQWDGLCSIFSCSYCDESLDTKSNCISVDGEESIIFEAVPDDDSYTVGSDIGISILEKSTTSFLDTMFSVFNNYRHLLMKSSDAIVIIDAKTQTFLELNDAAQKLSILPKSQIIGKSISEVTRLLGSKMMQPSLNVLFEKLRKKQPSQNEMFYLKINGKSYVFEINYSLQKFYNKDAIIAVLRDITKLKDTETQSKKHEDMFNLLINTSQLPIMLVSKDGKILKANKLVQDIISNNPDKTKTFSALDFIPKDVQKSLTKLYNKAISIEIPVITPEGTKEYILSISKPDNEGNKVVIGQDISEIKTLKHDKNAAKKELHDMEARYEQIIETSKDAIVLTDLTGKLIFVNKAGLELYGTDNSKDMIGMQFTEFIPKNFIKLAFSMFTQLVKNGLSKNIHIDFLRKDRTTYPAEINASLIKNSKGFPIYLMGTIRDITERKNAEEQIKDSEKKYRTLYESSSDAIMTLEPPTWNFTSGNPATVKMFRAKDEKEFTSKAPFELSPEIQPDGKNSMQKALDMINKAMKEGSNFFEWTHRRINGEDFPATVLLTRLTLGGKTFLQATVRDITERKKTEAALKIDSLILNNITDSVITTDMDGKIISWNPGSVRIFGYSSEEMIGKSIVQVSKPEERKSIAPKQLEELREGDTHSREWEGVRKDGSPVWLLLSTNIMKDSAGKPVGMVGIGKDITKHKQAEENLSNIKDGIFTLDSKGRFTFVNPVVEKRSGIPAEKFVGTHFIDLVHPDYHALVKENFKKIMNHEEVPPYSLGYKKADGGILMVEVNTNSIIRDGNVVGLHGVSRDITGR